MEKNHRIKIDFETNIRELKEVNEELKRLQEKFDRVSKATSKKSGDDSTPIFKEDSTFGRIFGKAKKELDNFNAKVTETNKKQDNDSLRSFERNEKEKEKIKGRSIEKTLSEEDKRRQIYQERLQKRIAKFDLGSSKERREYETNTRNLGINPYGKGYDFYDKAKYSLLNRGLNLGRAVGRTFGGERGEQIGGHVAYNMQQTMGKAISAISSVGKTVLNGMGLLGLFSIAGLIGKSFSEAKQLAEGRQGLKGLGGGYGGTFGVEGGGVAMGMKTAQYYELAHQTGTAYGTTYNLANRSQQTLGMMRAFGLDQSVVNSLASSNRLAGTDGEKDAGSVLGRMLTTFNRSAVFGINKGDFAKIGDLIQANNQITASQLKVGEKTMPLLGAAIMGKFAQIGGKFADPSQNVQTLQAIDAGIRNPGNDFKKALIMRTIQEVGGGNMDIYDVQKIQDKGLFGSEQGGKILQNILQSGRLGQGKTALMNLKNLFPQLDYDTVERLYANKDKIDYSGMTGRQIEDQFSGSFISRGISNTSAFNQVQARIDDRLGAFGEKVFTKLAPLIETLIQGLEKFLTIIEKFIDGDFSGGFKDILGIFGDIGGMLFNGLSSVLKSVLPDWMQKKEVGPDTKQGDPRNFGKEAPWFKNYDVKDSKGRKMDAVGIKSPNLGQGDALNDPQGRWFKTWMGKTPVQNYMLDEKGNIKKEFKEKYEIFDKEGKKVGDNYEIQSKILNILEKQYELMKINPIQPAQIIYNDEKTG